MTRKSIELLQPGDEIVAWGERRVVEKVTLKNRYGFVQIHLDRGGCYAKSAGYQQRMWDAAPAAKKERDGT